MNWNLNNSRRSNKSRIELNIEKRNEKSKERYKLCTYRKMFGGFLHPDMHTDRNQKGYNGIYF